jgi:hypothetical protein
MGKTPTQALHLRARKAKTPAAHRLGCSTFTVILMRVKVPYNSVPRLSLDAQSKSSQPTKPWVRLTIGPMTSRGSAALHFYPHYNADESRVQRRNTII